MRDLNKPGVSYVYFYQQPRDSGNDFCQFSFLGYPKRNDFVPSRSQKK